VDHMGCCKDAENDINFTLPPQPRRDVPFPSRVLVSSISSTYPHLG
jgi:hypothetical protein